jgi:hypothetical protein
MSGGNSKGLFSFRDCEIFSRHVEFMELALTLKLVETWRASNEEFCVRISQEIPVHPMPEESM